MQTRPPSSRLAALLFLGSILRRVMTGARPIFDPQAVPVSGRDAHLPARPAEWLTAQALREHFATVPLAAAERPGDGSLVFPGRQPRAAAVLIPLVQRPTGLSVLLTRRNEQLRDHAGQIAFPGGAIDADDVDAWAAARREAGEEIGLAGDYIEPIGQLPRYCTVTAYEVTPCVALVREGFVLRLHEGEVAEAFEVPLDFLMDPAHHQRHRVALAGLDREFLSMPWGDYFIWGATAAMLRNLYHQLGQGRSL
jgi:8-oxo-dGTP pyrophosphatase MutT (NUDIX family)